MEETIASRLNSRRILVFWDIGSDVYLSYREYSTYDMYFKYRNGTSNSWDFEKTIDTGAETTTGVATLSYDPDSDQESALCGRVLSNGRLTE